MSEWNVAPYVLHPRGDWVHVLLSSPLARYKVLDPEHVRIYGKGRTNFSGLLCRPRLKTDESACRTTLYAPEVGGALVLYGGTAGREKALELRREAGAISVHAFDETSRDLTLMRGAYPAGKATLAIQRNDDTYTCRVDDHVVWRGSLPFRLPPARVLLRALGDSRHAEGRERSAVFGPVEIRSVQEERELCGSVVSVAGTPVPRAWIHLAGDPFGHAQTGDDGGFSLSYAPGDADVAIAGAEGYEFASRPVGKGERAEIRLPETSVPRPEYPRPDFNRSRWWKNLNGIWRFALDPKDQGGAESWQRRDEPYRHVIRVPFPWTSLMAVGEESLAADHRYTGIWGGYTGTAWYKRTVRIPKDAPAGEIGVLQFLCVNAEAEVYWDGERVTTHDGGFSPFECEVGELEPETGHDLVVKVRYPREIDPTDTVVGKQGWWFTHAPGIWQTVWLEARSGIGHISRFHVRPDVTFAADTTSQNDLRGSAPAAGRPQSAAFHVSIAAEGAAQSVEILVRDPDDRTVHAKPYPLTPGAKGKHDLDAVISIDQPALWDVDAPNLYRLEARLLAGKSEIDRVETYAGLRQIRCDFAPGHSPKECDSESERYQYIYLNNRPIYLLGILDQAYNPWGVYTYRAYGPDDLPGSIQNDVKIAKELGYNLDRLHIKANEPLWLYETAKAGLLVWDEIPNFRGTPESRGWRRWQEQFFAQHLRDFNCPSIVIRSIVNESWGAEDMRTNPATQAKLREFVDLQRKLEPHRLVVDNSAAQGYPNRHVDTDINDEHIYLQDWWEWKGRLGYAERRIYAGSDYNFHSGAHEADEAGDARQSHQPFVISEFSSHGRKTLAVRMFPKIAGFVKIDLVDQEWERFTPFTYTRTRRPAPFLDADLRPLGAEMEHSLDAVVIDAPPTNYLAQGTETQVSIVAAAFHRTLDDAPLTLHIRCVAVKDGDLQNARSVYEDATELSLPAFSVQRARKAVVRCPDDCTSVYFFAWLTRDGVVTARDYVEWKSEPK